MKKGVLLAVIVSAFFLVGCSGGGNTATQATPTPTTQNTGQTNNIDPTLSQGGYDRLLLTDPALYSYLKKQELTGVNTDTGTTNSTDQRKIGRTSSFQKAYKYGISGSATIVSAYKIRVGNFTYNGACGPVKIGLVINNNLSKPLATVKEINAAVSSSQFDIEVPSNLSLSQFDSLGIYCPDAAEPVSTADFTGF
jgi:outer membrane biogenesis lipoprotein LolB